MTPLDTTNRAAAAECFHDVERLIHHTVNNFRRRFGGDYEELFGQAQIAYLLGFDAYCNGKNNSPVFETEIRRWVHYELFDRYRTETGFRRVGGKEGNQRRVVAEEEMGTFVDDYGAFDRMELEDELTADGRELLALVLDTPPALAAQAAGRGGNPNNWRACIKAWCRDHLGWTAERIADAWAEVQVAIA